MDELYLDYIYCHFSFFLFLKSRLETEEHQNVTEGSRQESSSTGNTQDINRSDISNEISHNSSSEEFPRSSSRQEISRSSNRQEIDQNREGRDSENEGDLGVVSCNLNNNKLFFPA